MGYGGGMSTLEGPRRGTASGKAADSFVVLLHGLSSNGAAMMGLADDLAEALPDTAFYAPNAPFQYDAANDPKSNRPPDFDATGCYMWYNRYSERTRIEGLYAIAEPINAFIAECARELGVEESRGAVIGHSQGCIVGLNIVPRRAAPLAALVAHSGYLFSPDSLAQRKWQRQRFFAEVASKTPTCGISGIEDPAQAWESMVESMTAYDEAGIHTELHVIGGMGHNVTPRSTEIMQGFLREQLGAA